MTVEKSHKNVQKIDNQRLNAFQKEQLQMPLQYRKTAGSDACVHLQGDT